MYGLNCQIKNFTIVDFQTPDFQMMTVNSHLNSSKFSFLNNGFFESGYHRVKSLIAISGNLSTLLVCIRFFIYKWYLIIFQCYKKYKKFDEFIECLDWHFLTKICKNIFCWFFAFSKILYIILLYGFISYLKHTWKIYFYQEFNDHESELRQIC